MRTTPQGQPLDHPARLAALEASGLMDSPVEETFDRYTRIVRQATGCDISLVSLVDDHRQFFKSSLGLDESIRETPLTHSFCRIVVTSGAVLRVDCATNDQRVCDNQAISELGVNSYLGAPIRTASGLVLGSLCAIGLDPREWSPREEALLTDLADAVSAEIRLRLLARSLQLRIDEDQMADEAREDSMRSLVHDLRTPIGSIISCTELLDDEDPAERRRVVELIQSMATQALHMVEGLLADRSLLDLASHLEPVSVAGSVHQGIEMVKPLADASGQTLVAGSLEADLRVQANPAILHRILINLLTNTTKHCPAGTSISCSAHPEGGGVTIAIADSGPGIPDHLKDNIFHRSKRDSTASGRPASSFGLGLDFCRRAAEAMGGSMAVEDTPGGGATFLLRLAAAK